MANVSFSMTETLFRESFIPALNYQLRVTLEQELRKTAEKVVSETLAGVSLDIVANELLSGLNLSVSFNWKQSP